MQGRPEENDESNLVSVASIWWWNRKWEVTVSLSFFLESCSPLPSSSYSFLCLSRYLILLSWCWIRFIKRSCLYWKKCRCTRMHAVSEWTKITTRERERERGLRYFSIFFVVHLIQVFIFQFYSLIIYLKFPLYFDFIWLLHFSNIYKSLMQLCWWRSCR